MEQSPQQSKIEAALGTMSKPEREVLTTKINSLRRIFQIEQVTLLDIIKQKKEALEKVKGSAEFEQLMKDEEADMFKLINEQKTHTREIALQMLKRQLREDVAIEVLGEIEAQALNEPLAPEFPPLPAFLKRNPS